MKTHLAKMISLILSFLIVQFQYLPVSAAIQPGPRAQKTIIIASPDGKIHLLLQQKNGSLAYAVNFNKKPVIEYSHLGMIINGKLFGDQASTGEVEKYTINETYPYRGVHNLARNHCNGVKININATESSFVLDVRVFNDGVAFRYLISNTNEAIIEKDTTEFVIPSGSLVWSQPNIKYYEGIYKQHQIEAFKQDDLAGPPITILLPENNGYAAITEGGLTDFAGMALRAGGKRNFYAHLSGVTKKSGLIESPWRIIEIGKDLNTLVNCDIIANVSPSFDPVIFPKGYDTDWIKPGRSVWSWLAGNGKVTLETMKRFSDYASALGFEYNLVDEGWSNWKDGDKNQWDLMKELVDYSAKKNVKIWVWKAYPDRKGIAGIKDPEQRKAFFRKCKDLGIAGLKVDFFDAESQEIIDFYQAGLKDAATDQLMMDFHGANKPTGETRTWPNEMTREAIKGMEGKPPWALGNTTLPFTRYLAGHADYTPVHFGKRLGEISWAHHIASMIIFTSPFLCIAADPQSILDNPAKAMMLSIPSTWDETIVLPQSKIGELVFYARRKGKVWYLAAMNGLSTTQTIKPDLSFLGNGKYKLSAVMDDKEKQDHVLLENTTISAKSALTIKLNAEGGYVGRFNQ
ncbi:glycoside hydrolase family 97 catalytic domain-containing protein [Pedobacter sp. PAMC26386]|nr:glycoside hydrolase family 97 catalytic domain-containing protein [Pedobacter sp. PAMC26386]